jgi:hypothetical protein
MHAILYVGLLGWIEGTLCYHYVFHLSSTRKENKGKIDSPIRNADVEGPTSLVRARPTAV